MSISKQEARRIIRDHFASYIDQSDNQIDFGLPDEDVEVITDVWRDEAHNIAKLLWRTGSKP